MPRSLTDLRILVALVVLSLAVLVFLNAVPLGLGVAEFVPAQPAASAEPFAGMWGEP